MVGKQRQSRLGELTAVSLFASSGIGDLALRAAGVKVVVANEFVAERANLFRANFPDCLMLQGDIRELGATIVDAARMALKETNLDILFATPPCQGMSKNGRGKLLRGVRDGLRDALDPRNQLATFVPPIAHELDPRFIIFENVPEMAGTLIEDTNGELVELLDYLSSELDNYLGIWKVIEFADYGVPQRRQRLITFFVRKDVAASRGVFEREDLGPLVFPPPTHSPIPTMFTEKWISVEEVIGHLPPLDAKSKESACGDLPFHRVPTLDERKYWWVSNTPVGASAFDNQCVNIECFSKRNPIHGASAQNGINQANTDTPIRCVDCGVLLPRPCVEEDGVIRIMKGFTSAYKRMRGDLPSAALTRNLSYVSSDQKIHPTQNRVLSLLEAMILHTITEFEWKWESSNGRQISDKLIRETIGESIPPKGLKAIVDFALKNLA